ncbi:hypothetical protein QO010_000705 [Caulobacter ginsengisoli]|uniref:Uncharacterized protein n=1 Tax=Caulobacter ginsengisoli TaxID=400775 RepID=A0ABU0ILQ5_9CAUL|nr:hypothetical protein [Caulobacter ginsengisoli]MDQ0462957.1 hypothetical protein [Caulobacter ginsengisoli]
MTSTVDGLPNGVVRGEVRFGRLLVLLIPFGIAPTAYLVSFPSVGTAVLAGCCLVAIADLVSLEGDKRTITAIEARYFWRLVLMTLAIFGLRELALDVDAPGLATPLNLVQWAAAAFLGFHFFVFFRDRAQSKPMPQPSRALTATVVGVEDLRARKVAMEAAERALAQLPLFDPDAPTLMAAWDRKDTARLEALLLEGDALNRASWQRGMDLYNPSAETVDAGRSTLQQQLAAAEALLTAYNIDYGAIPLERSDQLGGVVATTRMQRDLSQKLNYTAGTANALSKAASGAMPWQFAAAVAAGALVMQAINHSKALRQLKEMEGTISLNAEAARGDFALMRNLLSTRLIPQMTRILAVLDALQSRSTALRVSERLATAGDPREAATRLAFTVVEARHLLELTAGN